MIVLGLLEVAVDSKLAAGGPLMNKFTLSIDTKSNFLCNIGDVAGSKKIFERNAILGIFVHMESYLQARMI